MFQIIRFECCQGHAWDIPLPNYTISLKDACPECQSDAISMTSQGMMTLGELQKRLNDSEC